MDPPQGYYGGYDQEDTSMQQRGNRRNKGKQPPQQQQFYQPSQQQNSYTPELFDDMSAYNQPPQQTTPPSSMMQPNQPMQPAQMTFPGQELLQDPNMANMATNMAMQYGQQFMPAGKEFVEKKLDHFLSVSKLKYYFAVDTTYVLKKLGLLVFPFAHKDWSLKYDNAEPVAPRFEINAPDLYIPSMAFVTYVLVCSVILGTQNRFTPEQLGMTASSAFVWLCIELIVIIMIMYIIGISGNIKYLDILSFCGYKYVGMILTSVCGLLFEATGYYASLLWCSVAISFFIARSLRLVINPEDHSDSVSRSTSGNKRRLYILLTVSLIQPVFMYFLTKHLIHYTPPKIMKMSG